MFMKWKVLRSMKKGEKYTVSEIAKQFGCSEYFAYDRFYENYLVPLEKSGKIIIDKRNTYTVERVK